MWDFPYLRCASRHASRCGRSWSCGTRRTPCSRTGKFIGQKKENEIDFIVGEIEVRSHLVVGRVVVVPAVAVSPSVVGGSLVRPTVLEIGLSLG